MFIDYVQILRIKVQKEYDDFIEKLKNIPSSETINYAYEKVIKEDILICILNKNIDNTKAKSKKKKKKKTTKKKTKITRMLSHFHSNLIH